MENEKKTVPAPTIRTTPAIKPPTTTADAEPSVEKKIEPEKPKPDGDSPEENLDEEEGERISGETEFNNRVIGGAIDGFFAFLLYLACAFVLFNFLAWLIAVAYLLTRDSLPFLNGQSLGKKVVGSRAVREDDSPLTGDFKTSAIRNALMLVWPVELIALFIRQNKPQAGRRLGDDFAQTKVVNVD